MIKPATTPRAGFTLPPKGPVEGVWISWTQQQATRDLKLLGKLDCTTGFGASCALICTPLSRPFGAGFGIGTVCEKPEDAAPATDVAIRSANPQRMPRWVKYCVISYFGSLLDAG